MRCFRAPWMVRCLILMSIWPQVLWAFAHAQIGSVIENAEMPTLDGGKQFFLGDATANVFIFFRPGREHSEDTLRQLARLEKETAGKSVHWAAIVSDKIPKDAVRQAVERAGVKMPVLIDVDDALYGKLGVVLYPSIGITDKEHTLINYQHFTKINYGEVVRARIRFLLGEIDRQELDRTLSPPAAGMPTNDIALRHLNLARKLYEAGRYDQAAYHAGIVIKDNAKLAEAHTLMGDILLAQGKKGDALKSFEQALQLNPSDTRAQAGRKACAD